jgi:hypothetical protein
VSFLTALGTTAALGVALPMQAVPQPQAVSRATPAVLSFPDPWLDDSTSYQGYQTRFFRDSKRNTVQVYLDRRSGRAVQLWADAANESLGFTVRDASGRPVALGWGSDSAIVSDSGGARAIEYRLTAAAPQLRVGWLLLGSMRVERDFQYARHHLQPFDGPPFRQRELVTLIESLTRLEPAERQRHLALVRARTVGDLRARLVPTVTTQRSPERMVVRAVQPTLDDRNHLVLEIITDPREATATLDGRTISIRSRAGSTVGLTIRATTDAAPLTPIDRDTIFNREFLDFLDRARTASDSARGARDAAARPATSLSPTDSAVITRYLRLEREVRGVELLSSREKLMAGLPNFATYFGRDGMMSALMMRPVWTHAMTEHEIASVLRKLSASGEVSHEEALGGQAIRENAAEYGASIADYRRLARGGARREADSALARARDVLRDLQAVRENYRMMDDELQLPVLAARYLGDPDVAPDRKRAFLNDTSSHGTSHLALLLRELGYVATLTARYARTPTVEHLVAFPKRDATHWFPGSWRDSNAGYANGRFAMDINAIWAPKALESTATILTALRTLGFTPSGIDAIAPEVARTPLAEYVRDSTSLARAVETWRGARHHFDVALAPSDVGARTRSKLAWLPVDERRYWEKVLAAGDPTRDPTRDSLRFPALSLDSAGRPIPVVNTDAAMRLFLEDLTAQVVSGVLSPDSVLRVVDPFLRPYPTGLFVAQLGPVVANDNYASRTVWEAFRTDLYHSPRVVWGREVNLFVLGTANQIAGAYDGSGRLRDPALASYVRGLGDALRGVTAAVRASGLAHNELWSYRIADGRLLPSRYGTSSDVQLWNTTDLAVQFVLSRLPHP